MNLWGLKTGVGQLAPVAARCRKDIQEWAGQRFMSASDYAAINKMGMDHKRLWKRVRKNHPGFRIVSVTVSEEVR